MFAVRKCSHSCRSISVHIRVFKFRSLLNDLRTRSQEWTPYRYVYPSQRNSCIISCYYTNVRPIFVSLTIGNAHLAPNSRECPFGTQRHCNCQNVVVTNVVYFFVLLSNFSTLVISDIVICDIVVQNPQTLTRLDLVVWHVLLVIRSKNISNIRESLNTEINLIKPRNYEFPLSQSDQVTLNFLNFHYV